MPIYAIDDLQGGSGALTRRVAQTGGAGGGQSDGNVFTAAKTLAGDNN